MASRWNQQEQGAKRRRSNQGTRGTTQPAASNPNKNRKSTDTNRNSGRPAAAKPAPKATPKAAPKAAPKQNKPKTVYFRSKDDAKPVYRNPAKSQPRQKVAFYSKDNARPVTVAEQQKRRSQGNVRQTIGGALNRAVQANASAARSKPAFRSRDYGKEQIKRPGEMNVTDYAWQTRQQDQKAEHNLSNQRKARQMYVESGQAALQRDLAKLDMRSGSDRRGKSAADRLSIDYKTGKWYWDGKEMTQAQFDQQFPMGLSDPTAREMAEKAGYIVNTRYFPTKEDEKDKKQEIGWVARNMDKYAGLEADNVSDADAYDLMANRRKFAQAQAAGDKASMERYHDANEAIRAKYGYSGGTAGDQILRGNVSANEYAQLNETGDAALSNARRRLVNARTPAERERIQKEIDWILTNPDNQAGEENKHQIRDLTKGSVLSSIGNTAVQLRNIRDMNKYAGADDAYNAVPKLWQRVSELYDQMGNTTDEKQKAKIQKQIDWLTDQAIAMEQEQEKWATDPNSPYFDPTVAERLGMPTSVQPNRWDEMAERGDQLIAEAKEGMNAGQSFAADLYSNAIQMIPTTVAGLIPGAGGASVGAKLWNAARAATQTAALTQMGLAEGGNRYRELVARGIPEEQARTDALMSTAISMGTESVPLHYLGKLVSGTQRIGRTIPGAIASSFALEGTEEGVSYAANALWSWMRGYEQDRFDWNEMGKSMLAGGIMGGLHAGLGVAVNRAVTHLTSQGRDQDANRVQAYMDDIDGIMEQSQQYDEMVRQGALSAEEGAAIQSQLQQDLVNKIQSIRDNVQTINDYQSMADQGVISQAEADQVRDTYGESITGQQTTSREALERAVSQRLYQAAMAANSINAETPAQAEARQAAERTGRVQDMYQRGQSVMGAYQADREAQFAREIREAQQTEPVETVSTANPVEEAQRMTDEALRQKDNALRQAAEARARVEAIQNAVPVQETRPTMADVANQRLESISGTMGENGSQALMTMAGELNNTTAVRDFVRVYNQALMGVNTGIVAPRSMTQAEFNRATEAGFADRMAGITLDLKLSEKAAGRNKNAGVNWSDSYVRGMDRQTAKTLDAYAKTIGAKIEFTEFTGANGSFVRSGNVITIAKDNPLFQEDPVLFVMGHESTHRMQDLDVKSYNAFRDYVMSLPGSNEALEETLSTYRKANAFKPGENQRYAAMDEVTADYAGRLLRDHEELRQFIRDMQQPKVLRALLKAFRAVRDVLTGRERAQADEAVRLLEEAIKGAEKSLKKSEREQRGQPAVMDAGDPDHKIFSIGGYRDSGRATLKAWMEDEVKKGGLTEEDADDILTTADEIYDICKKYADSGKYLPFSNWAEAQVVVDENGKPVFSVQKNNNEYDMNLDFSLICKKRRALDQVFNMLIQRGALDDFDLTGQSVAHINEIIRQNGFEVACFLCFVDSKRFRQAKAADDFVEMYNSAVESMIPSGSGLNADYFNFGGDKTVQHVENGIHTLDESKLDFSGLTETLRTQKEGTVAAKIARHLMDHPEDRRLLARGDFMSTAGFDAVKVQKPRILSLYNSKKGTGGPKGAESETPYNNEVIKMGLFNRDKAYKVGGVRIQSFSDFVSRMVFDYVQMTADLAAKRLPAHAYTKEADFAKMFGLTGIKINMSLVPKVVEGGIAPGLDAKGRYAWEEGQSFGSTYGDNDNGRKGFRLAVKIQNANGYTTNCGTIAVGVSDAHIRKMLKDPDIRMIIPYHKSNLNPVVAMMNHIDAFQNYEPYQSTLDRNGKKLAPNKDFDFNEAYHRLGDAKAATEEYVAWCEKNGYTPKFSQFLASDRDNYYKLIIDFASYDRDGNATPQGDVKMAFPKKEDAFGPMKNLIRAGLKLDAETQEKMDRELPAVVDQIMKELPGKEAEWRGEGARFSITPQADADYMAAVESGDMETAQRMVDEAADNAGYERFGDFFADKSLDLKTPSPTARQKQMFEAGKRYGDSDSGFNQFFAEDPDLGEYYVYNSNLQRWYYAGARDEMPEYRLAIRYGDIPEEGRSRNWATGELERGVSAVDFLTDKTQGKQTIYDAIYGIQDATKNIIGGWDFGIFGSDGEPLLVGATNVVPFTEVSKLKLADPVTYDDNGNVIPLSERFNAETGDIRYSLGTEGYDRARLMRENQMLREKAEYWKDQTKKSGTKVDRQAVKDVAASLGQDWFSSMEHDDIRTRLIRVYDAFNRSGDWAEFRAMSQELANDMIESARLPDDENYLNYEDLRTQLKDVNIILPEGTVSQKELDRVKGSLGNNLKIREGKRPNLDETYDVTAELFPELFPDPEGMTAADKAKAIIGVAETVWSREEANPFQRESTIPAGILTNEIMESFWDLPGMEKTLADKAAEKALAEKNAALARLRKQHSKKYKEGLKKVRDERDRKLKEKSQKYLAAKKENSQKQKERELRAKIMRHCGRLSAKLKSGTDKQHVPEVMQRIVATALDSINLGSGFTLVYDENGKAKRVKDGSGETTKRTEAFEELRNFYQQIITADPDEALAGEMPEIISKIVVSEELPRMIDGIIGFRDTPIANLGKADLDKIWETVKAIETTISTYDKALGQARFETISEPAFAIRDYASPKKDRRNYVGGMKHVDRLLNVGMLKPIYFLYRFGDGGKMIWKMIEDAQGANIRYLDEIRAYQEEHFKPGLAKRLEKQKHTFNFNGQEVELTTAQLINLYNLRKREQAEGHILEGGFRPDQIVKGIRDVTPAAPWHFTADQIGEMLNVVAGDAELVRIADAMMDGIKSQAVHGNAASMEVYGIKKYRERNYWPIESDENQTQTDIKNEAVSKTVAGSGFAKATQKGANNAVILRSAFDVYDDHVVGMAKYAAWLGPLENLRRILNFRYKDETGHFGSGVKEMLTTIIGKDGPGYYKKLMDDLNAGIKATSDNPFQQFIGSYKAAAIAGNIRVVAQQLTSIPRAMEEIDPQDFLLGMAQARPGQWENEIKKYAPIAIWKDWGYFTADTGRQMRNIFWGDDNFIQTANNFIMNNRVFSPGTMDAIGWTAIWNALKSETKRTRKDLDPDSEEFKYAVRDRFNEVINLTQVVDGIPQRSQLMRSENDVTKMATSFMGEPTTTYNMLTFAIHEARTSTGAERGKAMRHLARTTVALATSIALNAAAQSLVDAMRDDDKDEKYWEKFFQALYGWEGETRKDRIKSAILNGNLGAGMNPLTYIPFIKDVVSKRQGYKVTRMDMDIISRVMDSYDAVVKAMNGEGKKTKKNAWINFIAECSRFLGVPVANIKRDILSGVSTVFQVTGNYRYQYELEKFLYNIEGTGNFSEFAKLAYLAKRDGDTEAYEAIRADLIANGPKSEKDVDKKIAELEKKAVTDTEEYQTALAQKTDAYHTMLEASPQYQEMDEELQGKVQDKLDSYAQYQVLGQSMEVDGSDFEKVQAAEASGVPAVDWAVLTVLKGSRNNYEENGKTIKVQDQMIETIDQMGGTDEEKSARYRTLYDSDKNNPWVKK